jgi:hypothetical protein
MFQLIRQRPQHPRRAGKDVFDDQPKQEDTAGAP